MSGSHGDLFHEIGKLVLAADAGQAINLSAKSQELAERYANLGMPAATIAKAIARSLGAIGISMALVSKDANGVNGSNGANGHSTNGHDVNGNGTNGHGLNGHGDQAEEGEAAEPVHAEAEDGSELLTALPNETHAKAASAIFPSGLRLTLLS